MNKAESRDTFVLLHWATGTPTYCGPVADVVATQAARRLAARAYKMLDPGLHQLKVDLERETFAEPSCRVCGCTDEQACPDGCWWVPDPMMLGDLCSGCAELLGEAGLLP